MTAESHLRKLALIHWRPSQGWDYTRSKEQLLTRVRKGDVDKRQSWTNAIQRNILTHDNYHFRREDKLDTDYTLGYRDDNTQCFQCAARKTSHVKDKIWAAPPVSLKAKTECPQVRESTMGHTVLQTLGYVAQWMSQFMGISRVVPKSSIYYTVGLEFGSPDFAPTTSILYCCLVADTVQ